MDWIFKYCLDELRLQRVKNIAVTTGESYFKLVYRHMNGKTVDLLKRLGVWKEAVPGVRTGPKWFLRMWWGKLFFWFDTYRKFLYHFNASAIFCIFRLVNFEHTACTLCRDWTRSAMVVPTAILCYSLSPQTLHWLAVSPIVRHFGTIAPSFLQPPFVPLSFSA
jgi:hypothetical protein